MAREGPWPSARAGALHTRACQWPHCPLGGGGVEKRDRPPAGAPTHAGPTCLCWPRTQGGGFAHAGLMRAPETSPEVEREPAAHRYKLAPLSRGSAGGAAAAEPPGSPLLAPLD